MATFNQTTGKTEHKPMPPAVEVAVNQKAEQRMQAIADAVRTLSLAGVLEIKIGKIIISAHQNNPRVGPLTVAECVSARDGFATGDLVFLLADSGIAHTLDSLEFRMTIKMPKSKTAKAGK